MLSTMPKMMGNASACLCITVVFCRAKEARNSSLEKGGSILTDGGGTRTNNALLLQNNGLICLLNSKRSPKMASHYKALELIVITSAWTCGDHQASLIWEQRRKTMAKVTSFDQVLRGTLSELY